MRAAFASPRFAQLIGWAVIAAVSGARLVLKRAGQGSPFTVPIAVPVTGLLLCGGLLLYQTGQLLCGLAG